MVEDILENGIINVQKQEKWEHKNENEYLFTQKANEMKEEKKINIHKLFFVTGWLVEWTKKKIVCQKKIKWKILINY